MAPHTKRTRLADTLSMLAALGLWMWSMPTIMGTLESYKASAGQPVEGQVWSQDGKLVVLADKGGSVVRRMGQWQRMERDGVDIVVAVLCASACTLAISNPRTCTAPAALWMFHRAYEDKANPISLWGLRDVVKWSTENSIKAFYPEGFNAWEAAIPEGQDIWVVGDDLAAAGWVTLCEEDELSSSAEDIARKKKLANDWNTKGPVQGAELAALLILPRNTKALTVEATARRP